MESDALLFAEEEFADATVLGFDYRIWFLAWTCWIEWFDLL
jgi:hypothetical protein